jgi:hypothetical protein
MGEGDQLLAGFLFEQGLDWWEAELFVPLWGDRLPVRIAAPAAGPSRRQMDTLRSVLHHPTNLRAAVGEALRAYYMDELGCITPSLGHAPPLRSADDVWPAMSAFAVYIPDFRSPTGPAAFEMHMDPRWDEDHGLCVLFRDWVVLRVDGQTDCRGHEV